MFTPSATIWMTIPLCLIAEKTVIIRQPEAAWQILCWDWLESWFMRQRMLLSSTQWVRNSTWTLQAAASALLIIRLRRKALRLPMMLLLKHSVGISVRLWKGRVLRWPIALLLMTMPYLMYIIRQTEQQQCIIPMRKTGMQRKILSFRKFRSEKEPLPYSVI